MHGTSQSEPPATALIGIDWGTSSCRVWALAADGEVLASVRSDTGALSVTKSVAETDPQARAAAYRSALQEVAGDLLAAAGDAPVIACGMVGSTIGWHEAGYTEVPTSLTFTRSQLTPIPDLPGRRGWIVPGLHQAAGANHEFPDVIRGEETQLIGVLATMEAENPGQLDRLVLLPGTHTKWVQVRDGRIAEFSTSMTGELFGLLVDRSILGDPIRESGESHTAAFRRGLAIAAADTGQGLANRIFAGRTMMLDGLISAAEVKDLLSGILIGDEVFRAVESFKPGADPVALCGSPGIVARYQLALEYFGCAVAVVSEDATATGLAAIAHQTGILQPPVPAGSQPSPQSVVGTNH